jgi:hypothetical protein
LLPRKIRIIESVGCTWVFGCRLRWIYDHKISTSGYVFNLLGGVINWMRKRLYVVALSIIEVEYMEATHARKEELWLQRLYLGIGLAQQTVSIYYDS